MLVDTQDVHLSQDALRAGDNALPACLANVRVNDDMLSLMLGRALGWISFHGSKGTEHLCFETITIVKKSLAGADSAQRYRSYAEIRRKIMLWDSCYHLRMLLQQQLVALLG